MMPAIADMTARVRGEEIPVRTEAMLCNRCGFHAMTDAQSDAYTIASADVYRTKHGLLNTEELKQIRKCLGMSFRTFARYLRVGEASPKRWEAGLVQDQAMDQLLRLKSDLATARENVTQLEARLGVVPAATALEDSGTAAATETRPQGRKRAAMPNAHKVAAIAASSRQPRSLEAR
jgi:putative zinc finger/helix-turn-helix YgiT family protein